MSCKTYSSRPAGEERRDVPCALCGTERPRILWKREDYSFSKCPRCGLVYQFPQPKQEELVFRYDEDYFAYELENEQNFFGLMWKALGDVRFFQDIEAVRGPGSILDVGCATGRLLEEMKKRGWREKGVEVCGPSAAYGRETRGVDILTGTLEEAELPSKSFDVVHASHLIEHLTDPALFLRELNRILKDGGYALITTPNVAGLQALLLKGQWRSAIADHMYLFSTRTLRRMLEREGFAVEHVKTWGGIAVGLAPQPLKRLLDAAAKRFGFGDVMVMRARKPSA